MDLADIVWRQSKPNFYEEFSETIGIACRPRLPGRQLGVLIRTVGYNFVEDMLLDFKDKGDKYSNSVVRYFNLETNRFEIVHISDINDDSIGIIVENISKNTTKKSSLSLELNDGRPVGLVTSPLIYPQLDVVKKDGKLVVGGLFVPCEYFLDFKINSQARQVVGSWDGKLYKNLSSEFEFVD